MCQKNRLINSFETIFWALGGQSKHSLGPDSVAQLQAMRDLVTPATLAWEREGDLEAQGKEQQSWRDVALAFCQFSARRRGDTREDSQEEAAQNEGVRVSHMVLIATGSQLTRYQQVEDKARMRMSVEKIG